MLLTYAFLCLTVLSVAFIYYVLSHMLPWFLNTVWNAGSLSECREIRNAASTIEAGTRT